MTHFFSSHLSFLHQSLDRDLLRCINGFRQYKSLIVVRKIVGSRFDEYRSPIAFHRPEDNKKFYIQSSQCYVGLPSGQMIHMVHSESSTMETAPTDSLDTEEFALLTQTGICIRVLSPKQAIVYNLIQRDSPDVAWRSGYVGSMPNTRDFPPNLDPKQLFVDACVIGRRKFNIFSCKYVWTLFLDQLCHYGGNASATYISAFTRLFAFYKENCHDSLEEMIRSSYSLPSLPKFPTCEAWSEVTFAISTLKKTKKLYMFSKRNPTHIKMAEIPITIDGDTSIFRATIITWRHLEIKQPSSFIEFITNKLMSNYFYLEGFDGDEKDIPAILYKLVKNSIMSLESPLATLPSRQPTSLPMAYPTASFAKAAAAIAPSLTSVFSATTASSASAAAAAATGSSSASLPLPVKPRSRNDVKYIGERTDEQIERAERMKLACQQ